MTTALVTTADYSAFVGIPEGDLDTDRVEALILRASGLVCDELGQRLERVDNDQVEIVVRAGEVLLLPELPVWSVASVERYDGISYGWTELVEETEYTLELGHDGREGIVRAAPVWGWGSYPRPRLRVTYSHGYTLPGGTASGGADLPTTIETVVLRLVARGMGNPAGLRSETIGSYSYSTGFNPGDAAGLTLSAADLEDLGPYYPGHRQGRR